jgi:hypothetical protein
LFEEEYIEGLKGTSVGVKHTLKTHSVSLIIYQNRLLANARPDPVLRYLSNAIALESFANAQ